ncbi:unnamed protein product [Caretta caretta]
MAAAAEVGPAGRAREMSTVYQGLALSNPCLGRRWPTPRSAGAGTCRSPPWDAVTVESQCMEETRLREETELDNQLIS